FLALLADLLFLLLYFFLRGRRGFSSRGRGHQRRGDYESKREDREAHRFQKTHDSLPVARVQRRLAVSNRLTASKRRPGPSMTPIGCAVNRQIDGNCCLRW